MVLIICSASIVFLQFRFTARCFLDELVVWQFALCSSAISATKLSDFCFEATASKFFCLVFLFVFWSTSKWSDSLFFFFFSSFFLFSFFEAPASELSDFFGSTLCYQEREVARFIHPSMHDTGQVTNMGPIWETVSVKCADLPVYMVSQFRDQKTMSDLE